MTGISIHIDEKYKHNSLKMTIKTIVLIQTRREIFYDIRSAVLEQEK